MADYEDNGRGRPLLDKIEEIRNRHMNDGASRRRGRNNGGAPDVDLMFRKQALAKALKALDQTRQENMQQYQQMKERQRAAFEAMVQTHAQQQGGQPGAQPGGAGPQGQGLMPQPPQGPQQEPQQGPQQQQGQQMGPQQGGLLGMAQ